jgi:integrase
MRKRHKTQYPGITYRLVDETKPAGPRRYIVWFSDTTGRETTKTLPLGATLEDARLEKGKLENRKANGETLIRTKKDVSALLDDWASTLPEKTAEGYAYGIDVLKDRLGPKRATELTASDVARLIQNLKREGKKTWTVKKILTPLSSSYRLAMRDGIVASNPVSKLLPSERPKGDQREMRTLDGSSLQLLLGSTTSPRWRTLFSLLAFTGLRISEALGLTWDDVTENSVIVRQGKTEAAAREVILIPAVRSLLAAEKLKQAPGTQFVFATAEGGSCGRRDALRALHAAEKKAGLPNYTLHELRHTFASILIAQGELPTFVAKQMGHKDPSITMSTYAHLFEAEESTDKAREKLQAAMGGMV